MAVAGRVVALFLLGALLSAAVDAFIHSAIPGGALARRNPGRSRASTRLDAGVMFSEGELDTFVEWLELQRSRAASPQEGEVPIHVLDAGENVDNAILFSGVMWQVLADVSTNSFGPDACDVIVHFPGLVDLGIEVLEIFEDLILQVKGSELGQGSALPELKRLEVTKTVVAGPARRKQAWRRDWSA